MRHSNTDGVIGRTKTTSGERVVPMFGSFRKLLLETRAASRYKDPEDFVFPSVTGAPRSPNGWLRWGVDEALKASGVKCFRYHDLRHFAVSQLIAQGANIVQIARVAGHPDPSVTLRVYSHLMADGLHQAAELYDPLGGFAVDAR